MATTTASALNEKFRPGRLVLPGLVLLALLSVLGQTWHTINQDKQMTFAAEATNALVAVRVLEEHASQTLDDAVHTLDQFDASIGQVANAPGLHRTGADLATSIKDIVAGSELKQTRHLKTLQFVDRNGRTWVSVPGVPDYEEDLSERSYIKQLMTHHTVRGVLIGHPYPSRYDSQLVIPVARNVYDSDGQWLGIISVDLRLSYFRKVYAGVAKDNNASVALIANEGFVFVRSPFEARYLDRDISDSAVLARLNGGAEEGTFSDEHFLDDEFARQYSYRKVGAYPVTTVYGRDFDTILAPWHERNRERFWFAGVVATLIVVMAFVLQTYVNRLHRSRQSLSHSEHRFVGIFERSPTPLALFDQSGSRLVEVNSAWLALFGFHKSDVMGVTLSTLNLWIDDGQQQELLDQLALGQSVDCQDVALQKRDGTPLVCLLSGSHFADDEQELVVFAFVDVTHEREIEQEIRELNFDLEDRVASRTQKLESANQSLNDALSSVHAMQAELIRSEKMAALGSLVAGIAHELNTPIGNSITVASTLQDITRRLVLEVSAGTLKRSALDSYLSDATQGVDILMRTLTRAVNLVTSFKQVAVDQSGNIKRDFGLNEVLREIILTLEPSYKKTPYKLTLDLGLEVTLHSYPGAIAQVISNFVNNSLMHGFEGRDHGTMKIVTRLIEADQVQLIYSDDGVGIGEEGLKHIFDPFYTTKLGRGGSGLGMHIVYNIVTEVLGGKISISSKLGEGTTATLHLPRRAPAKAVPESAVLA